MKLEQLASLLKKDAAELQGSLNLESQQAEVSFETIQKLINETVEITRVNGISEGKRQGEGKAKKETLTEAEKKLKEKFDVDGDNFDNLIDAIFGKIGKSGDKPDEKILQQNNLLKTQVLSLTKEKEDLLKTFEQKETVNMVKSKVNPILLKFEFSGDLVKDVAISSLIEGKEFVTSETDGTIFVSQNGQTLGTLESIAEKHFSGYGKPIQTAGKAPSNKEYEPGKTSYGSTMEDLWKAFYGTKDLTEKVKIKEEMELLEKQN